MLHPQFLHQWHNEAFWQYSLPTGQRMLHLTKWRLHEIVKNEIKSCVTNWQLPRPKWEDERWGRSCLTETRISRQHTTHFTMPVKVKFGKNEYSNKCWKKSTLPVYNQDNDNNLLKHNTILQCQYSTSWPSRHIEVSDPSNTTKLPSQSIQLQDKPIKKRLHKPERQCEKLRCFSKYFLGVN